MSGRGPPREEIQQDLSLLMLKIKEATKKDKDPE